MEKIEEQLVKIEVKRLFNSENFSVPNMWECSLSFMAYSIKMRDYRFINAALKINDRIRKENSDPKMLAQMDEIERSTLAELKSQIGLTK